MYRGLGPPRDNQNRPQIGRSPPRRRRTPEDENKFCIFCKVQLSTSRLYEEHKNSAVHKQKEILISKAFTDGLQYCYTCEKIFPSKLALDAHCLMTRHKPLYRVEELQQEINNKNAVLNPAPPPAHPPETRRAREEKERQDIVTKLNEVRGSVESTNKNTNDTNANVSNDNGKTSIVESFFCELCNVDCMNPHNLKIHSASWRHRSNVDKKKEEEKQKFDKEAEQQFDAAEEVERKKTPATLTGNASYFCEVCSIASNSESAYLEHLKNRKHFRQVGQMRRPYKCYFCNVEFNVAKDFNYHLESRLHMDKAFHKKDSKGKKTKDDEWVEKKTERREHHREKDSRDSRKDDRGRSRNWHSDKDKHRDRRLKESEKDSRKAELKDPPPRKTDGRKVEIVDIEAATDKGIKDLREKLTAQKNIIITKANSPDRVVQELPKEGKDQPIDSAKSANLSRLAAAEQEFDAKFEALMKQFANDHDGLKEQLSKEREKDINGYQKYEEDFRELKEEEDFIRGNIDKLDDDDPCKQDYIIDIIRVQRKMEEVRLELEMKEVTIIKRENSYRKYFPEPGEENKEVKKPEDPNFVYDYNHGDEEETTSKKSVETRVSNEKNHPEPSGTDLRIKLERERLLKRLGPELESVDPSLREKLLSVILEKDKDNENSNPSKEAKESGDTRTVVKDNSKHLSELTKREKQLELELASLKSGEKKKKKAAPKSLVPQYDDVDDKKKDIKKKARKRSVSSSSSSRSSSSSSDGSYYKNKKKRKTPPKSRVKSKQSASLEKSRRKRRSRSMSRDRDRKKRSSSKKSKEDERKKRSDRSKERRRSDRSPNKKTPKTANRSMEDEHDSDVQVLNPTSAGLPISVLGSTPNIFPIETSTNVIQVSTIPSVQPVSATHHIPPSQQHIPLAHIPTSHVPHSQSTYIPPTHIPPQRREQFSFWKNQVVSPVPPIQLPTDDQQKPSKESPKEDIWETAFSGGTKEDHVASSSLNIFDPSSGAAQLPEDILNILKSVAPMMQQTQNNQSAYKYNSRTPNSSSSAPKPPSSSNLYSISSSPLRTNAPPVTVKPVEEKKGNRTDSRGIRSILKKAPEPQPLPTTIEIPEDDSLSKSLTEIPGLDPVSKPTQPEETRSALKQQQPAFQETRPATSSSYYDDLAYAATEAANGRRDHTAHGRPIPQDQHLPRERAPMNNHRPMDPHDPMTRRPYEHDPYDNRKPVADDKEPADYNITGGYRKSYVPPPQADPHDPYSVTEPYRPPPVERDALERPRPAPVRTETLVNPYDTRALRERDPYMRSEITHRVIDYSYVRDTRIIPGEAKGPPRYEEGTLKQPVRYPGETDDEYYARFERFYEMSRRGEGKLDRDSGPIRR